MDAATKHTEETETLSELGEPADGTESVEFIEDELLVEEVSIDGMCGVY